LEVYVIDNGSRDASCAFVRSHHPHFKLIRFERNMGFAEAYNQAVNWVNADYIVLLNNDTIVEPDFVSVLVEIAESNERAGSVGCKIAQVEKTRRYGPVFFTGNGLFVGPLFFGSAIGKETVYSTYEETTECLANCAAAVLYRKSLIDEIGLFDPQFWSDWEDLDLGFRICIAGYHNIYTPFTKVLHTGAASYGSVDSRNRVVRMTRNMLFTYIKNYDARNIVLRFFPLIFGILPYREIAAIVENEAGLLLRRDITRRRKLRAIYGASALSYLQFVRGLRRAMAARQSVQSFRKASDDDVIRRTSKNLI
jgi:GT2 family glycosyltransferase